MTRGQIMRRALWLALALGIGFGWPSLGQAQTDLTVHQFFLPGTNTMGYRVHASRTHMGVQVFGRIHAEGGYRVAYTHAHGDRVVVGSTRVAVPVAGTPANYARFASAGVLYQRVPYQGRVVGIALGSSVAVTAGTITAEATVYDSINSVERGTGLTTGLDNAANTRWNARTISRASAFAFSPPDAVGCRLTTTTTVTPLSLELVCTVIVEM